MLQSRLQTGEPLSFVCRVRVQYTRKGSDNHTNTMASRLGNYRRGPGQRLPMYEANCSTVFETRQTPETSSAASPPPPAFLFPSHCGDPTTAHHPRPNTASGAPHGTHPAGRSIESPPGSNGIGGTAAASSSQREEEAVKPFQERVGASRVRGKCGLSAPRMLSLDLIGRDWGADARPFSVAGSRIGLVSIQKE